MLGMQVGFEAKMTNRREKEGKQKNNSKKSNFHGCMNLIDAQGKGGLDFQKGFPSLNIQESMLCK